MTRTESIYPNDKVIVREVGLRDGLQLVKEWPDISAKKAWLDAEHQAGARHFEIGSFLPAKGFPQFADIFDVIKHVGKLEHGHSAALALNERGAEDAISSDIDEIVCVLSATEEHSRANMRRSREEALELIGQVCIQRDTFAPSKIVNVGISMAFGCTIAGEVLPIDVLRLVESAFAAGADMVGLADTIGYAGPTQIGFLCKEMARLNTSAPLVIHLHDTRGLGIANAAAALDSGVRIIDASLGGLGGCPFAPGATGNIVFEDVIFLCERMGFATNIDIEALGKARLIAKQAIPSETFYGNLQRAGVPKNITWDGPITELQTTKKIIS